MILKRVRNTIKRYNLIEAGDKVVMGVSGGPDSLALLYLLNTLKKELRLTLHIAHLDHMLRVDSYKDREFVENLSLKLKVPMTSAKINVRELAKKGSLEEIARNARLGFLFKVARDTKANKIALGHNLDDQAETVLMRVLRGTGLYGLSAILAKRNIAGYWIIRPLIEVTRKDIESFLKEKRIKPRIDTSNFEDIYFRNRIRRFLLPLLKKKYNKNIKEVLASLAVTVGSDYDYLSKITNRTIKGEGNRIRLNRIAGLHPAIQRLIFRKLYANIKGDTRALTFQHIREIEDLLLNRPVNSIVDLPKAVSVVKKKTSLLFYKR